MSAPLNLAITCLMLIATALHVSAVDRDNDGVEDDPTVIQQEGQKSQGKQSQQQVAGDARQIQMQEDGGSQNQQQIVANNLYKKKQYEKNEECLEMGPMAKREVEFA